jgi:hypothetical protein
VLAAPGIVVQLNPEDGDVAATGLAWSPAHQFIVDGSFVVDRTAV